METFDVVIVGGGPAGLSAAVWLGRCRRSVLVCDAGEGRNARSRGVHGFLTRDGVDPAELRALGRAEADRYGVRFRDVAVRDVGRDTVGWVVELATGPPVVARKLLLATGLVDVLPPIEGLEPLYGQTVLHCPYCDGYEVQGQALGVLGSGREGAGLALTLKRWSDDVHLFTNGPARFDRQMRHVLHANHIPVTTRRLVRLEGADGQLERLVFQRGVPVHRRVLFVAYGTRQRSELPAKLGCRFDSRGNVLTNRKQQVGPHDLFVAGDASKDVHFAIVAAAEGARAAYAINSELTHEDQLRPSV